MKAPKQTSLFDDRQPNPNPNSSLVTIVGVAATLSTAQRAFNRLIVQIRGKRAVLAQWSEYAGPFQTRMTRDYLPIRQKLRAAQRLMVGKLDEVLSKPLKGERLSKVRREKLSTLLCTIAADLLGDGPDSDLSALVVHYGEASSDDQHRMDMEAAESLLGSLFGSDAVRGHAAENVEDLLRQTQGRVSDKLEAEAQKRQEAEQRRKQSGRRTAADLAAERKAQAEQQGQQSLREIFRKLASSLHPDREADPDERERKTELMKRINMAYQNNDLLTLLTLQIEVEQIDASALAGLPDARLKHYNQVLREQLQTLDEEIRQQAGSYLGMLSGEPGFNVRSTQDIDWLLNQRIGDARAMIKVVLDDVAALADPARRKATMQAIADALVEPDLDAAFFSLFDEELSVPGRRRRRR